MRRLLQPLWFLLALAFLAEAWLWDHLEPVVARVVAWLPLRAFKDWLTARIAHLSPPATLGIFLLPAIALFPLKLLGVWLLAHHYWLAALGVMVCAKLFGIGVAAFIFDATRPKLLQMAWFRRVYEWVLGVRGRAMAMVMPIVGRLRAAIASWRPQRPPYWLRRALRTRRRIFAMR